MRGRSHLHAPQAFDVAVGLLQQQLLALSCVGDGGAVEEDGDSCERGPGPRDSTRSGMWLASTTLEPDRNAVFCSRKLWACRHIPRGAHTHGHSPAAGSSIPPRHRGAAGCVGAGEGGLRPDLRCAPRTVCPTPGPMPQGPLRRPCCRCQLSDDSRRKNGPVAADSPSAAPAMAKETQGPGPAHRPTSQPTETEMNLICPVFACFGHRSGVLAWGGQMQRKTGRRDHPIHNFECFL